MDAYKNWKLVEISMQVNLSKEALLISEKIIYNEFNYILQN